MNLFAITLVSDNIKIINTSSCPLIFEVVDSHSFMSGKFNQENNIIIDGYDLATYLFESAAHFSDHKIAENVFWFYSIEEIGDISIYYIQLKSFIFDNILSQIKEIPNKTVSKIEELKNISKDIFKIFNNINNIEYLYDGKTIYSIDLNYFSFILNKSISSINDLIDCSNFKLKTFSDIKIHLKEQGLVDKTFSHDSFFNYFKLTNYLFSDDPNEFYKWIIVYFYHLDSYISIDKKVKYKITSNLLGINELDRYNNFYENIVTIENYLSNIKIKNINFNKFKHLEFPIKDGLVQYEYNGSDTVTGRMYPTNLYKNQSLQTLSKEQKIILSADKNCTLIEFDYKSFEFDILCILAGIPIDKNVDPHIDIVKYLFGDDIISDDIEGFRITGKNINYSLIYGMRIEKIVDTLIDKFCNDEDKEEITKESMSQIRDFIQYKLENHWIIKAIKKVTDNILENNFNASNNLLTNYFGRFIRVEKFHAILNNFISSSASDYVYIKMRLIIDLLEKRKLNLKKNKIILQNHDSILLQLEDKIINETDAFETISTIMDADINGLIGRAKYQFGVNWGKLE